MIMFTLVDLMVMAAGIDRLANGMHTPTAGLIYAQTTNDMIWYTRACDIPSFASSGPGSDKCERGVSRLSTCVRTWPLPPYSK